MHFFNGYADLSSSYCSFLPEFLAREWRQMAESGQGSLKPEEPLVMQKKCITNGGRKFLLETYCCSLLLTLLKALLTVLAASQLLKRNKHFSFFFSLPVIPLFIFCSEINVRGKNGSSIAGSRQCCNCLQHPGTRRGACYTGATELYTFIGE